MSNNRPIHAVLGVLILPSDIGLNTMTSPTSRSRVTNGRELLPNVDGRSRSARRYRDIVSALVAERGGEAALSESEKALVRSAASLTVQSEAMAAAMVRGEPIDPEQMTRVNNALTRTLSALNKRKPAKAAAPDLASHLASKGLRTA